MHLGNLSALKEVPHFYYGFLCRYMQKISLAFIHAHDQNLIHGNFNLSKVIAQRLAKNKENKNVTSSNSSRVGLGSAKESGSSEDFNREDLDSYNYFLTNFEPWRVDQKIKEFENNGHFRRALNTNRLTINRHKYIQICKL